jgi:hypothetical protein
MQNIENEGGCVHRAIPDTGWGKTLNSTGLAAGFA